MLVRRVKAPKEVVPLPERKGVIMPKERREILDKGIGMDFNQMGTNYQRGVNHAEKEKTQQAEGHQPS
jgi:hypothetical protein